MQKETNFYQKMAAEHRLQENGRCPVPLYAERAPINSAIWDEFSDQH